MKENSLKKYLKKKNRSILWLARQTNISYPTLYGIVKKGKAPSHKTATKLVEFTGLSYDDVMKIKGDAL